MTVLPNLAQELEALRAENAKLRALAEAKQALRFKVSEKGALSVYGLQSRFPVTLYRGQWERLLAAAPQLTAFIDLHADQLSVKAD